MSVLFLCSNVWVHKALSGNSPGLMSFVGY